MILADFIIKTEKGLFCPIGNFYIDAQQAVATTLISHAHGDHACRDNQEIYCTPETAAIMELRYKKAAGKSFYTKIYGEDFQINGIKISFYPAGHILGSAQILMEYHGVKYLYTGDYKLQPDETCTPIEYLEADVLITESTFADPKILHPDPVEEIKKLNQHEQNVLLGTYSLGKAQRLIRLINDHCPQRKILLHYSILPISKLHERFGITLGKYEPYNRKLMKHPDQNYVYLVPPMTFNSYFRANNVCRAFASGWKNLQTNNDLQLFISDHVDWNDILKMIDRVKPQEIWTVHGNGNHLKNHFEKQIPIKALN
ncbi:MAG: MBL fold metallo-hydrolase [Sphingobacteriaceae bacterium]